jgi:hypothetical protein
MRRRSTSRAPHDETAIPTFEGVPWTELTATARPCHGGVSPGLAEHVVLQRRRTLVALVIAMCVMVVALSAVAHTRGRGVAPPMRGAGCETSLDDGPSPRCVP